MKRKLFNASLTLALSILSLSAFSQSADPVLLQIAGEKVTRNEFIKVFEKNNIKDTDTDQKALDEYLDLYINFRLKVTEARALGMDTIKSFRDELAGYRKQLAQPYLMDNEESEKIIREAYNHLQYDVRASHILVRVDKLASAADTLAAWNKIMQLRKRILKGEDFGKVAAEASEDPSAKDREANGRKIKGNRGDLGYFTAFDMVYPFEAAVYNAKVNEVTMPVIIQLAKPLLESSKLCNKKDLICHCCPPRPLALSRKRQKFVRLDLPSNREKFHKSITKRR